MFMIKKCLLIKYVLRNDVKHLLTPELATYQLRQNLKIPLQSSTSILLLRLTFFFLKRVQHS